MRTITKLESHIPGIKIRKKVAAYARVSKNTERTMHSLSSQISYYNGLIQSNPDWEFAGIYADEAIPGTTVEKRANFRRLIKDCDAGKIDIIITKSISRFARNTVDLLETVRHLKALGIEVRFEKEHINTLTTDGELMLTILASYAQEEVETMSQNIKWTIRKRFQNGQLSGCCSFLGYKWDDSQKKLVVVPEEAEIVRSIFKMYNNGYSLQQIVDSLKEQGVKPYRAQTFEKTTIRNILTNIKYTGNLLLQLYYSQDPITKKAKKNTGELPQYYSENSHEAIIDMDTFQAVQRRLNAMREEGNASYYETRAFSRKIVCGECGRHYSRIRSRSVKTHTTCTNYYWTCSRRKEYGKKVCPAEWIPEKKLEMICCDVLGWADFNPERFRKAVDEIHVSGHTLEFVFPDGSRKEVNYV